MVLASVLSRGITRAQQHREPRRRLRKWELGFYFHYPAGTCPTTAESGVTWRRAVRCGCEAESEYTVGPKGLTVIAYNWESNFSRYNPRWIHRGHDTVGWGGVGLNQGFNFPGPRRTHMPWVEFKGGVRLFLFLFFQPGPELILAGVETLEFDDRKGQKEGK